jgi:hypothetical protein
LTITSLNISKYVLYASTGYSFKKCQLFELNAYCNVTYSKIFNCNQWESVISFINGLDRLDLPHILLLQRAKFYKRLGVSTNYLMRDLFWEVCINKVQSELVIEQIFHSLSELIVFARIINLTARALIAYRLSFFIINSSTFYLLIFIFSAF